MLRKFILTILLLCTLYIPVAAAEVDLAAIQPPETAQAYMPETEDGFLSGLLDLLRRGLLAITPDLKSAAVTCAGVLAAAILCGLFRAGDMGIPAATSNLLGAAAVGVILLEQTNLLIRQGLETVQSISDYGKLLLPVMSAALVASGGPTSASGLYLGTALFDSVLTGLISGILVPMLYVFLALSLAVSAIGNKMLERMRDFFKNLITWGLRMILTVFFAYMAITGVVSGTADATAVKVTKMTISSVVPVVGGILSDAAETVLAGASTIRSTAGVVGLLAVLAITVVPFLQLAAQYLLLKLTSALCSVVGNPEQSGLVESFAQAMGLVLAMVGTGCLLHLISIVCFMKGVG